MLEEAKSPRTVTPCGTRRDVRGWLAGKKTLPPTALPCVPSNIDWEPVFRTCWTATACAGVRSISGVTCVVLLPLVIETGPERSCGARTVRASEPKFSCLGSGGGSADCARRKGARLRLEARINAKLLCGRFMLFLRGTGKRTKRFLLCGFALTPARSPRSQTAASVNWAF